VPERLWEFAPSAGYFKSLSPADGGHCKEGVANKQAHKSKQVLFPLDGLTYRLVYKTFTNVKLIAIDSH